MSQPTINPDGSINVRTIDRNAQIVYLDPSRTITPSEPWVSDLPVGQYTQLILDVTVTSATGTSPAYWVAIDRKDANGNYHLIEVTSNITEGSGDRVLSIGPGLVTRHAFGDYIRIRQGVEGTDNPTITRSLSITGK